MLPSMGSQRVGYDLATKQLQHGLLTFVFLSIRLFIWLCRVLVTARGIFSSACELLVAACGISFMDKELNPGPLHWELRVLATGLPGKSLTTF